MEHTEFDQGVKPYWPNLNATILRYSHDLWKKRRSLIHVTAHSHYMRHGEKLLLGPDHKQDAHAFYSQKKMYMKKEKES